VNRYFKQKKSLNEALVEDKPVISLEIGRENE
jgi:hypothetical protein